MDADVLQLQHQHSHSDDHKLITLLKVSGSWWRHQMETFFVLLALCARNSPVTGEFPAQKPVTRNFDVFFARWINVWANNGGAGDMRPYRAHFDVIVMVEGLFGRLHNVMWLTIGNLGRSRVLSLSCCELPSIRWSYFSCVFLLSQSNFKSLPMISEYAYKH